MGTTKKKSGGPSGEGTVDPITLDELGNNLEALLGPLGEILNHMRDQNAMSEKLIKHNEKVTASLASNNKRLLLLIVVVFLCSIALAFVIMQMEFLSSELHQTQHDLTTARKDLSHVLKISRASEVKLDNTPAEVKKAVEATKEDTTAVTLEKTDAGVEVVVRPKVRKNGAASKPVVKIPVTVPSNLKVEPDEPEDLKHQKEHKK